MIRESFVMTGGRVDLSQLRGASFEKRVLAEQANGILDSFQGTPTRERDGNHLTVNRGEGDSIVHQEVWFTEALPLSIAEYPAEAQDRTYEVDYLLTPDPASGTLQVEKNTISSLGEPTHPEWNLSN